MLLMDVELRIRGFGLMIKANEQRFDLRHLSENLNLDVFLNGNRTLLMQKIDDVTTAVSESFLSACKSNHYKKDFQRPTGYVKLQYSKRTRKKRRNIEENPTTLGRYTITRPPEGPLPEGTYCSVCFAMGPEFHMEDCNEPVIQSLKVTLKGFINCAVERKTFMPAVGQDDIINLIKLFDDSDGDDDSDDNYEEIFENSDLVEDLQVNYENSDEILLRIKYMDVMSRTGPKRTKPKKFFSNCAMITHNFEESGAVSIRLYDSAMIYLVSCPWDQKDFYKEIIDKVENYTLDENGNIAPYDINWGETQVKTVFSSFSYFGDSNSESRLNLKSLHKFLTSEPPVVTFTKRYTDTNKEIDHKYLQLGESIFRTETTFRRDGSNQKITLKLLPCVLKPDSDVPEFCKPHKITVVITESGSVQLIFSYCKEDESFCDEDTIPESLDTQFVEIEDSLRMTSNFIKELLDLSSDQTVFNTSNDTITSAKKKTVNTVGGIMPYAKKQKLKIGEEVEIFDSDSMAFTERGTLKKIKRVNGVQRYHVNLTNGDQGIYDLTDIRPIKQSAMQMARPKTPVEGIENIPEPYEFNSECAGGKEFYTPFGGKQARDNLYYPHCEKRTSNRDSIYLDHIVNGFPADNEEEADFKVERNAEVDNFSGILKRGTTDIGNVVKAHYDGDVVEGEIVDKQRTNNRGLDNYVVYTLMIPDANSDDSGFKYIDIKGEDFLPEYRQKRNFEGVGEGEEAKPKLIGCSQKLGLSQSEYISNRLDNETQERILSIISNIMGTEEYEYCGRNTAVLTPKTIKQLTKRPFCISVFPANSNRVLFYSNGSEQYFINDSLLVMKIKVNLPFTVLIDGYINRSKDSGNLVYFPIDCLMYEGKKLRMNYVEKKNISSTDDQLDDPAEIAVLDENGLDGNRYYDMIQNFSQGRLFYAIFLAEVMIKVNESQSVLTIENPRDFMGPSVDSIEDLKETNLIEKTFQLLTNPTKLGIEPELTAKGKRSSGMEFVFIPQRGNGSYLRWKRLLVRPLVLELIKNVKGKEWKVGINKRTLEPIGDSTISIPKSITNKIKRKPKILQFKLNFLGNGKIHPTIPLILSRNLEASEDDLLNHKETQLVIDSMLFPIMETSFTKSPRHWTIAMPRPFTLEASEDDNPGTSPLRMI